MNQTGKPRRVFMQELYSYIPTASITLVVHENAWTTYSCVQLTKYVNAERYFSAITKLNFI